MEIDDFEIAVMRKVASMNEEEVYNLACVLHGKEYAKKCVELGIIRLNDVK